MALPAFPGIVMTDPSRYEEFSRLVQQASGQVVTYLHAVLLD